MIKNYYLRGLFLLFLLFSFSYVKAQNVDLEWVKTIGGPHVDNGYSIAIDSSGNVFTIGYFRETADFNIGSTATYLSSAGEADIYISKHDAAGKFVWAKRYGAKGNDEGFSIVTDKVGNIYICGRFSEKLDFGNVVLNSSGGEDIFIAKLDTDGTCIWAKNMGNGNGHMATAIATDPLGNHIYVVGNIFKGQVNMNPGGIAQLVDGECLFILKLKSNGDFVWVKSIPFANGSANLAESLDAIAVSNDDHLHIIGQFFGTLDFDPAGSGQNLTAQVAGNSFEDVFILKLDNTGKFVWVKSLTGTGRLYGTGISVDVKGNVLTTGSFDGVADFNPGTGTAIFSTPAIYEFNAFISKLDAFGNYVWAKQLSSGFSRGFGIDVDKNNDIYTTGSYVRKVDFNPGTGVADTFFLKTLFNITIDSDAFVLKLKENGDFAWAKAIATGIEALGSNQGNEIIVDRKGSVYTVGRFQGRIDFDPSIDSLIIKWQGHNSDVFIHKMSCAAEATVITLSLCEPFSFGGETYTKTGVYVQNQSSTLGCDSIITLDLTINQMVKPLINVDLFELSTVEIYDQYQWFLNGTILSGEINRKLIVTENGDYTVAVENKQGCKDTSKVYTVTNVKTGISDNNNRSAQTLIFPNPVQDFVNIIAPFAVDIYISSLDGKLLKQINKATIFSISDLASGMYLLHIKDQQNRTIKIEKLIKMGNHK